MKEYKHIQIGYTTLAFFGFAILVILYVVPAKSSFENTYLPIAILSLISILFCSLTIKVKGGEIIWFFGPYFWKKKIKLSEIERTETVTNSWWYGWGIRLTKFGWLYNVSGFKAVQITTRNGITVRLGTNDPVGLCSAIAEKDT